MTFIKILNKSKYNILSIFSCLILIVVFVFGCVTFAHAETTDNYVYGEDSYTYINDTDPHIMALCVRNADRYDTIFVTNLMGKIAFLRKNVNGYYSFYMYTENMENSNMSMMVYNTCSFPKNGKYYSSFASSSGPYNSCFVGTSFASYLIDNGELVSSNAIIFEDIDDLNTYLNTGVINNPIYQPKENVEFDSDIEIPLMAQCQVNGNDYLFNCKQSVPHDDYKLQVAVDLRLTPIYGNFASKQYSDKEQIFRSGKTELGSYDNKGTIFNTSFSTDDLLKNIDVDRKSLGFKEFYHGYNLLLPYKEPVVSEVIFYARNVSGSKCSNWVRVTFDLITETSKYEEVESVSGSNIPSDTKTSNSEYYPEDYVYNDNDAYGGGFNVSGTLNSLEHNYTQLVNFYKDLFSFLPSEIWLLLIGLASTMALIAILKFVRG